MFYGIVVQFEQSSK